MIWFFVLAYVVVSPIVGMMIGNVLRNREPAQPVEDLTPCPEPATPAVTVAPPVPAVSTVPPVPAVTARAVTSTARPALGLTTVDVRALRSFTGRTPRSLRPAWQRRALRALGL